MILCSCDEPSDHRNLKIIKVNNSQCEIYLKKVTWGISNDNCCTYISSNPNIEDTINEPYFRTLDFFYKFTEDSKLVIYHSDSLKRLIDKNECFSIMINEGKDVNYSNYEKKGFENILYK